MIVWVVDASISVRWLMRDESDTRLADALKLLHNVTIVVPYHWRAEMHNALLRAEHRNRVSRGDAEQDLASLAEFTRALTIDVSPDWNVTHSLALTHTLTYYDAFYLELALRRGAELATLDAALLRAATREGVPTPAAP